jgi:hypothetical protein
MSNAIGAGMILEATIRVLSVSISAWSSCSTRETETVPERSVGINKMGRRSLQMNTRATRYGE